MFVLVKKGQNVLHRLTPTFSEREMDMEPFPDSLSHSSRFIFSSIYFCANNN